MEKTIIKKKLDYNVHIEKFEGPLDLLLYLIKEAKIDIKDIFVSEVTEQYLLYMTELDDLDMEKASEFLEIAATLLEIKSNSLLPRIEDVFITSEDPAQKMIRRLEEYKLFKETCEKLKSSENVDRYYKSPDNSVCNVKVIIKDMSLDGLLDAFSKMLIKVQQKKDDIEIPKEIQKDPFTVDEKIMLIKAVLLQKKCITFDALFEGDSSKSEIIVTFQALLELIREQFIAVTQLSIYGEILIKLTEEEAVG